MLQDLYIHIVDSGVKHHNPNFHIKLVFLSLKCRTVLYYL